MTTETFSPPGLDLKALSAWFQAHVPGAESPLTATLLEGGRSNLTYRVQDSRTSWVVRRPPLGGHTPSAHDVAREYRVMSALRDRGVAVPDAIALCKDTTVTGAPFSVVEYVEGQVLRFRTDTAGLTPHQLRRCADGLVAELARLHAVPYAEAGLSDWGRPKGYLLRQLARWRSQWELVATKDLPELDSLHRRLTEAVPGESGASIVHGDFRIDNTLLDPADLGRVRAVVDWEMSTLGDPLADLGTFLAYRSPAVDTLLDSPAATDPRFPSALELAEQYELLTGRDITRLPFYLALAYFKIAVIAQGVHARYQQGVTIGRGFAGAGDSVIALVRAGLETLGHSK
ncbi:MULTISPECIES: phosphotransferase family protein [Streptomyces]|uniref:phosphotransferase family protein n=1 Tax=Streptomyces TaxID=1883 RepID=UPI0006AD2F24|nr:MULTISPECIES: phosphotransferase family protein [Streptomyces]ALC27015.1 acyl-CoA dehydrogenase [Streptomyces sp. CFMR 7]RZF06897.1 phosphotransferase family protein [Streptomyces albidoflavus]